MRAKDLVGRLARRTKNVRTNYGEDGSYTGPEGTLITGYNSCSEEGRIAHRLITTTYFLNKDWDDDNWEPVDKQQMKEDPMDKALVVQSEWSEIKGEGWMKIIKQDCKYPRFYGSKDNFKGSNGTILKSVSVPQFKGPDGPKTLYVRGGTKSHDNDILSIDDKMLFDAFLATIDEYNEEMAKPKVAALTQAQKDSIVNYSKDIATRAASIFSSFGDNFNKSKDMDGAMKAKVQLMTSLLGCIPMGVDTCPFCVVNHNNCDVCEYKNKHGNCLHGDSVYITTSDMIGDLRDYINTNYWKGV